MAGASAGEAKADVGREGAMSVFAMLGASLPGDYASVVFGALEDHFGSAFESLVNAAWSSSWNGWTELADTLWAASDLEADLALQLSLKAVEDKLRVFLSLIHISEPTRPY